MWGAPPDGSYQATIAAGRTAFAPRGRLQLATVINRDLWEIGFKKQRATPPATPPTAPARPKTMGLVLFGGSGVVALALLSLAALVLRRRRA